MADGEASAAEASAAAEPHQQPEPEPQEQPQEQPLRGRSTVSGKGQRVYVGNLSWNTSWQDLKVRACDVCAARIIGSVD